MTASAVDDYALEDRYRRKTGELLLTGMQALVRVPLELSWREAAAGRRTAVFISGYEGSPLAGFDLELLRQRELLEEHHIVIQPAVNEELAVTAVQGSQLASVSQSCHYDGVVGLWYGKAPGLDRASDAMRHANLAGAASNGGALVLVGDDSIAKSSTVPSSSEVAMAELGLAILSPADPQEIIEFGLHGIWLSRFSGLYAGLKLATNVLDGSATVRLDPSLSSSQELQRDIDGVDFIHEVSAHLLQPNLGLLEASLVNQRRQLALRYIVANRLNRTEGDPEARVGVITAGAPYRDTIQALDRLGITRSDLPRSGVRILKLGAVTPLDGELVRTFARGLDVIVVVEEKRPFVELAVKDALYGVDRPPQVLGKRDAHGLPFLREDADLPPEYLAERLARTIRPALGESRLGSTTAQDFSPATQPRTLLPIITRTPYFCSGCPHNRSTVVPSGSLVGAGTGCHGLATLMPSERVGDIAGMCQMGGEGALWTGMAPFVEQDHMIQNIGDGTFHHSGSLAVRAAVAAGVNITYKLLYNDAVAMTGGQAAVGKMAVPQVVQSLIAEGVTRVVITTDDPRKFRRVKLAKGVDVLDRSELIPIQEQLAATPGVTVLIHDQECATELRRKRKRGIVKAPTVRAFINERVCEGCGDCGRKSNCLSVHPTDSPFGRKTRIDQATCNLDYSCLQGDCPSFVSVKPSGLSVKPVGANPATLAEPPVKVDPTAFNVRLVGIGGTGIVTTAQILATAGTLAGMHVRGLDQLGLAQKGGAVVSDLRFSRTPIDGSNKLAVSECDLLLGSDLLVASDPKNLSVADRKRTIAVVSTSIVPTGEMILDPSTTFPPVADIAAAVAAASRQDDSCYVDARALAISELGSDQYANMVLVGVAIQAGALPLPVEAIERSVKLNGVAVSANLKAIETGRRWVSEGGRSTISPTAVVSNTSGQLLAALSAIPFEDEASRDRIGFLTADLVGYQDDRYAMTFLHRLARVAERERAVTGSVGRLTAVVGESLFKVMAYKDEYETARLYLDPAFEREIRDAFGDDARIWYKLHPPALRAMGMKKKLTLGEWFRPVFRVLRASRRVRGTIFDPFGYAHVRRVERRLIEQFVSHVEEATALLTRENIEEVAEILALPEQIRGYESIKLAAVESYEAQMSRAMQRLRQGGDATTGAAHEARGA